MLRAMERNGGRPYIVANFVSTVDGKVAGPGDGYWPIGSDEDLEQLLALRAECDVLVHGRQTALSSVHLNRLYAPEFQARLVHNGHVKPYIYMVISAHPDEVLISHVAPSAGSLRLVLVTTDVAALPAELPDGLEVWRCGADVVDLVRLRQMMHDDGIRRCALEAGPRLFGAFVAERLVDELRVTIAPKLFGTSFGTPTMIGGVLFAPSEVPVLELLSVRRHEDEIYACYRFKEVRA
jgi:5-amino-6-(5-phosphoribosylamino)uracil reductase